MRLAAAALALATAGATLTLTAGPAFAEESRQFVVAYQDLNLAAPAGRATLDARLKHAARRACGVVPYAGLREMREVASCQASVRAEGWNQITATAQSGQVRGTH